MLEYELRLQRTAVHAATTRMSPDSSVIDRLTACSLFVEPQLAESDSGAITRSKLAGLFASRRSNLRTVFQATDDNDQRLLETEQQAPCLSCQLKPGAMR